MIILMITDKVKQRAKEAHANSVLTKAVLFSQLFTENHSRRSKAKHLGIFTEVTRGLVLPSNTSTCLYAPLMTHRCTLLLLLFPVLTASLHFVSTDGELWIGSIGHHAGQWRLLLGRWCWGGEHARNCVLIRDVRHLSIEVVILYAKTQKRSYNTTWSQMSHGKVKSKAMCRSACMKWKMITSTDVQLW